MGKIIIRNDSSGEGESWNDSTVLPLVDNTISFRSATSLDLLLAQC